jgi:hypothetical protein
MNSDYDDLFAEPIIKDIVDNVEDFGSGDQVMKAMEICHGLQTFASDYNCSDPKLQAIWALLSKHRFEDFTHGNWQENPYGEEVYNYLVATLAPKLSKESWTKWLRGEE